MSLAQCLADWELQSKIIFHDLKKKKKKERKEKKMKKKKKQTKEIAQSLENKPIYV